MPKKQITLNINGENITVDRWITTHKPVELISLEGQLEMGVDFPCESDSVEEIVDKIILIEQLRLALKKLADEELALIQALFFSNEGKGISDMGFAKVSGIPRTTIISRKKEIINKLKKFFKIPSSP